MTIVKLDRSEKRLCCPPAGLLLACIACLSTGCSLFPDAKHQDSLHNPFPQLQRVAVLPFYNQSDFATLNTEDVAESYYVALQAVPGFEVLPVGVTKAQWLAYAQQYGEPTRGEDFQNLARLMDVDAVVVGSVTDYQDYYPPRMAMTVHWYAANDGFHPIPAGYGLPWGTKAEEEIPKRIVREAEFELAKSQLATQTPTPSLPMTPPSPTQVQPAQFTGQGDMEIDSMALDSLASETGMMIDPPITNSGPTNNDESVAMHDSNADAALGFDPFAEPSGLPADFPSPTDLIPDPPSPVRPIATSVNRKPVLSQTRLYRGDDSYFTERLANYVETNDDGRGSGWQGYLKRSDDFVRFCCHLHITEMLESRGGSEQSDLILRWPLSRY